MFGGAVGEILQLFGVKSSVPRIKNPGDDFSYFDRAVASEEVKAGVLGAAVEGQLNDAHLSANLATKIWIIHRFIYNNLSEIMFPK